MKYAEDGPKLLKILREYGDIVNVSGNSFLGRLRPPAVMVFRLDYIKELFINHGEHFSRRPTSMWFINKLFKKKGEFKKSARTAI